MSHVLPPPSLRRPIMLALVVVMFGAACDLGNSDSESDQELMAPRGERVEVTVSGEVSQAPGPYLFEIAGAGRAGAAVWVVNAVRGAAAPEVGRPVRVTGRVREFRRTVIEAEFAIRFGAETADRLEGRPVMVARLVSFDP